MKLRFPPRLILVAALLLSLFFAMPVSAASVELTAALQASVDKTASSAEAQTAAKLRSSYADLGVQLKADQEADAKIKALKYRNDEAVLLVRKQIREIDSAKVSELARKVEEAKKRYQPLFDSYAALNKQLSVAKSLKNKTLRSVLSLQADAMKLTVQLAREEIKVKDTAYKTAKDSASGKIKAARDTLATIEPLKVQIKAQRSSLSQMRTSLSPVWANFKYALKKNDAGSAHNALASLVATVKQIVAQQNKIYSLEVKIADIIAKVKSQHL